MITLKQALSLKQEELETLKNEIDTKVKNSDLNAYIKAPSLNGASANGVPILIKDNINVKGWEVTCSSKILEGYVAPYNASVIENLHANNMAGFGLSNMDEFAMGSTTESSCYGITKNPRDIKRVPGGSSGGSAAAVAGGLAIAALGSDTGGSIRQPASYCGCVGLKPTYGRVSRYGLIAYCSSFDQIGPITQNVEDASILFDALSGHDSKDSTSANLKPTQTFKNLSREKRFKIAVLKDHIKDANKEVQLAYENTIKALKEMGHEIVHKDILDSKYQVSIYYIISTAEACSNLARFDGVRYGRRAENVKDLKELYIKSRSEGFGDEVKRRIMLGNFVLSSGYYDAYYLKAQKVRSMIKEQYNKIFEEVDLIFTLTAPTTAPLFNHHASPLEMYLSDIYTIGANLTGLPALSLPVAKDSLGLPIGMQFIGRAFDEQSVLDVSYALEQELDLKFD
ncbi:Asp-tRNA(Asn)/Glu-tRNA(Gln) amidotransferase subunit GatA [Helicobacter cetorum]|uniref:Asp-tRNA(Asn)/Glu-tRNA(Gln) amidotransferase subunit GatA n=1 Tax=Helicobacter cetorum TaxID=138563 RepID=UPI000CF01DF4|nr:Asp-tRNA(Asn)/Glu-tRNA(Gln) amidotransferase subunit GatA [Helicobacter cetorum]